MNVKKEYKMEIIEGGCRYETIRNNAFWNNVNLDTRFHPDASDCEQAVNHLIDCKNQPTVALLARKNTGQITILIFHKKFI